MFPSLRPTDTSTDGSSQILKSNRHLFVNMRDLCDEIIKLIDRQESLPQASSVAIVFLFYFIVYSPINSFTPETAVRNTES